MKVDTMSRNVVRVMKLLSNNQGIARLLLNNQDNPLSLEVTEQAMRGMLNPKADDPKILPFPFDVDAETKDGSFIRVYYNQSDFNENATISEATMHIDIIVAKSLWLIHDDLRNESLIRPYELLDRVIDMVGPKGTGDVRLDIEWCQHLYINTKFDSIRLYCKYMSVETMQQNKR